MNANERESGESISVYSRAFAVSTKLQFAQARWNLVLGSLGFVWDLEFGIWDFLCLR
jgi:uncharacterized protein YhjY with autotransporter beta-barrel domain